MRRRTIELDTSAVGIVEFDASAQQRATVIANGVAAAEAFLQTWDWDAFRRDCPDAARGLAAAGGMRVRSPTGHEKSFSLPGKRITAW